MINEIYKIIEDLYKDCKTLQEVTELEEEIQGINSSMAADRFTDLCVKD